MERPIVEQHFLDGDGNPAGGQTFGNGFAIAWQRGPLGRVGSDDRLQPNGAFVEDVIAAVIGRIEHYQESKFNCQENADALRHLHAAGNALKRRTERRTQQGTEGTHEGS